VATIVASSSVFGLATQFRLHWFLSSVLAALVVLLALIDKVEAITPQTPIQDPFAYSEAWKEYSRLRRNALRPLISLLLIIMGGFASFAVLAPRMDPRTLYLLFWILASALLVMFFLFVYNEWKLEYWPCPRCGHRFRGFWVASIMPKRCNHCGLARSAESPNQVGDLRSLDGR
jgi:hypothetical protein